MSANPNHELMMKTKVLALLQVKNASATCYIYNMPPDITGSPLVGKILPIGAPYDADNKKHQTLLKVEIRATDEANGLVAANYVFDNLKDYAFTYTGSETDQDRSVVCVATTAPLYEGVDVTGEPLFGITFELTTII